MSLKCVATGKGSGHPGWSKASGVPHLGVDRGGGGPGTWGSPRPPVFRVWEFLLLLGAPCGLGDPSMPPHGLLLGT